MDSVYKLIVNPVCALLLLLISCYSSGQRRVIEINFQDQTIFKKAILIGKRLSCDSLNILNKTGNKLPNNQYTCQVIDWNDELVLHEQNGVYLALDTLGRFYSRDPYGSGSEPYQLNAGLGDLISPNEWSLLFIDDTQFDSLHLYAIPVKSYLHGKTKTTNTKHIGFAFDQYVYATKKEVNPSALVQLELEIEVTPGDGKIDEEYQLYIPIVPMGLQSTFSFYVYDLSGNLLKMYTNLSAGKHFFSRENIIAGTYRYKVLYNQNLVVKKGMIHFKEPPKPE